MTQIITPDPVASFDVTIFGSALPISVQATFTGNFTPIAISWDFGGETLNPFLGDGTTPSTVRLNPVFTYRIGGDYTIVMIATDIHGASYEVDRDISIQPDFPPGPLVYGVNGA